MILPPLQKGERGGFFSIDPSCFLGATDGSAAISMFSKTSEIASVALSLSNGLLRNDIATQSLDGRG